MLIVCSYFLRECPGECEADDRDEDRGACEPLGAADRLEIRGPRAEGETLFVPFLPVYGFTFPFALKLFSFVPSAIDRLCGATVVPFFFV
ncbi:MAG: hypothetical protein JWM41_2035 [Gemmatimonadetes bacterium]|nr:hypothetical protein [Gemmatimonadota bacterium]